MKDETGLVDLVKTLTQPLKDELTLWKSRALAAETEVSRLREGVKHFLKYEIAIENNKDIDAMLYYAEAAMVFRATKGLS